MANCDDLEAAFDTPEFTGCLADLIHCASRLFGTHVKDTQLANAQETLAAIDLESPRTVHEFAIRIVNLWDSSTQFEMEKLKNEIGGYFNM